MVPAQLVEEDGRMERLRDNLKLMNRSICLVAQARRGCPYDARGSRPVRRLQRVTGGSLIFLLSVSITAARTSNEKRLSKALGSTGSLGQVDVLLTWRNGVAQSHWPFDFVLGFAMGARHTERHERHHARSSAWPFDVNTTTT